MALLEQFNEVILINFDKSGNSVKPLLDKSSSDTHCEIVKDSILTVLGSWLLFYLSFKMISILFYNEIEMIYPINELYILDI
jgi:hypothetical protein